ncbi:helix-turn-helix domain-containing protein [Phytomonospora sp. NPDC050363]|uniref:IclR family transcriptional regulator n=1 Tax=Phytomonospora sp. NPDC050363 TaxID=3155642 RepID=UPI0033D570CC
MSVVARSLSVFDAFADGAPSLRLTDIAGRTGLPVPTTLRLVRELVAWGGLERQGDGSYRVGTRLWSLGTRAPCPRRLRDAAAGPLAALHAETGHASHAVVADGAGAVVVGERGGLVADGSVLPWHASAAGLVLLAYAREELRADVMTASVRLTAHTVVAPGLLAARLARVRSGEVAVTREEWRRGQTEAAVAIPGPDGRAVGAIGLAARTTIGRAAVAALRRAATAAGEALARH